MKTKTYRMKLVKYPDSRYFSGKISTRRIFIITADDNGNSLIKKMESNVRTDTEANIQSQYNNSDFLTVKSGGYQLNVGLLLGISGSSWYNIIEWNKNEVKPGDTLFTYVVPDDTIIKGFKIYFETSNYPQVMVTLDRGAGEEVVFEDPSFAGGDMMFASE